MKIDFKIDDKIKNLLDTLKNAGGQPRFVGGMVRDAIKGMEMSDIDIATTLKPDSIISALDKAKIKHIDTGSKHGTITAIINFQHIEITTLRIDVDCDGRHAKVEFTDSFEEDARRRDFTINAMSYCHYEGKLYDYFNGLEDLKSGCVKFIGDANERILEDHLRIIRFFRFSDRFAKELHPESLEACITHKVLIGSLSKERIKSELDKMILSDTAEKIFSIMLRDGVLEEIIPFTDLDIELIGKMDKDENLRYAAMFHKIPDLKNLLIKMKFSNADIKEIIELGNFRNFYGNLGKANNLEMIFYPLWIDGKELDNYVAISEVLLNPKFKEIHKQLLDAPPKFPINGNDLIEKGINGRDIAIHLEALKLRWIENDFKPDKSQLLKGY